MAHSDFLTCSKTCTENSNGSRNMCRPKKVCERQLALHVVSLETGKQKPTLAKNPQICHDHFKKYFCRIEHSSQKTQKVMKMKGLIKKVFSIVALGLGGPRHLPRLC